MSRFIRNIISLLSAVLLCFGLCGCQQLDNLRSNCGIQQENGSVVMQDGTVYQPLVMPRDVDIFREFYSHFSGYILPEEEAKDLPVLLYPRFASQNPSHSGFMHSSDGEILWHNRTPDTVLVRSDSLSSLSETLRNENSFLKHYAYRNGEYIFMSDKESRAVQEILNEDAIVTENYDMTNWMLLYKTTAEHYFTKDISLAFGINDDTYYLYNYQNAEVYQYDVPPHLYTTIKTLFERDGNFIYSDSALWS